jgi:threonine 3-dehydrogenase
MATMRAVELSSPGSVRIREDVPVPTPGPTEVLVKVKAAGICGTDVHIWQGDKSLDDLLTFPVTLGHEFCGVIAAVGMNVTDLAPGAYVSAEMHEVSNQCAACSDRKFHACQRTKIRGLSLNGAFADYVVVSATNVIRLPDGLPPKVGAILDPLGNAVHTALKIDPAGKNVAVVGMGPIGGMTAEVAAAAGARRIYAADVSPKALARARAWVKRRGLEDRVVVLDLGKDGRAAALEQLQDETHGGVDITCEISGHPNGINDAIRMTRAGGDVAMLGIPKGADVTLEGFSKNFIFKGLTLHAIIGREMFRTWDRMLLLLAKGMDVAQFVTAEYGLDQFESAIARFAAGEEQKVVLYPEPKDIHEA